MTILIIYTRSPKVTAFRRMLTRSFEKHKESKTHDDAVETMFSLAKSRASGWCKFGSLIQEKRSKRNFEDSYF